MTAGRKPRWTAEHDETLRSLKAQRKTYTEIAGIMGFSRPSISRKIYELGLSERPKAPEPEPEPPPKKVWRRWTAGDDDTLRKFHAEGWSDLDICYIMGRRVNVVGPKRRALGLKPNGKRGCPKGHYKHDEATRAKLSATSTRLWQDEEYRQRCLGALQRGHGEYQQRRWKIPPPGPERNLYKKLRAELGAKAAKAELGL